MNQGFKRLIPTILASIALFCSLMSFIMLIVLKQKEVWDYLVSIFTFLGIAGLLAIAILDLVNIKMNQLVFAAPLLGMVLAELFEGLEPLTDIGSGSSWYKYSYFNGFVGSIITILVIVLFVFSIYKKNAILTSVSLTYLASSLFISGLYGFNRTLFSLFTKDKFKFGFNSFMTNSASFLFYATYAFIAYQYYKENQ